MGATTGQLAAQNAFRNQSANLGQMQGLTGLGQTGAQNLQNAYAQMQAVANGQGPNPAQAALNQATGNNIQQQAALMASQRGAGANAGLLARQAAQQGANVQQQAAGQAAVMQANQQLAAMNQLGNLANAQLGAGQQQLRDIAGVTQNQVSNQMQGSRDLSNVGLAQAGLQQQALNNYANQTGNMVNRQVNAAQGLTSANQNLYNTQGQLHAQGQAVQGDINTKSDIAQANIEAGDRGANKQLVGSVVGGVLNGAGAAIGMAQGGVVHNYAVGGPVAPPASSVVAPTQSSFSRMRSAAPMTAIKKENYMNKGGEVPAMVSPGEGYIPPERVPAVKKGAIDPIQAAAKIPGQAKVKGDSLKNDTVPVTLEEGGIVLPRSIMNDKNPQWAAHKFVTALMAKGGIVKGKKKNG